MEISLLLFWKRVLFSHGAAWTEISASFVKRTTEADCRFETSKAMHGIQALFDATMILFQPVIELLILPMEHFTAHCFVYGSGTGWMPVCCDTLRCMTHTC